VWNNNTPPDISAENLNKMEQGIADAQFPDGGSTGQILSKTNDGTGWIDAPNSAEWGNITGQLSEQTDLVSQLDTKITMPSGGTTGQVLTKTASGQAWQDASGGGNVDTVNGISPDANKNVQTATDLTEAAYEALPSTKESDNVDYYLTDADSTIATAEDIPYDNTTSGMTATNVQGALDELTNDLIHKVTYDLGPLTLNGAGVQIPNFASIPNDKIVVLNFHRYAYGASLTASVQTIRKNDFGNGVTVFFQAASKYIVVKISISGLITMSTHASDGEPYVDVVVL